MLHRASRTLFIALIALALVNVTQEPVQARPSLRQVVQKGNRFVKRTWNKLNAFRYRARGRKAIRQMGLDRADLNALKKTGVVYDGKQRDFHFKSHSKKSWDVIGEGFKITKDGRFRYHPARSANGAKLPAFIQRLSSEPVARPAAEPVVEKKASTAKSNADHYRNRAKARIAEMGLTRGDLRALKKMGVVYDGKQAGFRFKSRSVRNWLSMGNGVKITKDGAYRFHPPRSVNNGKLPAFIERVGGSLIKPAPVAPRTAKSATVVKPVAALPAPEVRTALPAPTKALALPAPEPRKALPAPAPLKALPAPEPVLALPAPAPKAKAAPAPILKSATLRSYVSKALHKQASENYFLKGKRVRVTNVQFNSNRVQYDKGVQRIAWSATVKVEGGMPYTTRGFIDQNRASKVKGQGRVKISTPIPHP